MFWIEPQGFVVVPNINSTAIAKEMCGRMGVSEERKGEGSLALKLQLTSKVVSHLHPQLSGATDRASD
jgi:hypothetical protein